MVASFGTFGCQHPLQSVDSSPMERKGNVGIGVHGGGRPTITKTGVGQTTEAVCCLLLLGKCKVRHGVPEGGYKSQDQCGCKAGESEIGSPVLHLFRFEIEDDVHADDLGWKVQAHLLH